MDDREQKAIQDLLKDYTVGANADKLETENSTELRIITCHLAEQARRRIQIVSQHMDAALYDNALFQQHLVSLIKRNKIPSVQILVQDSTPAVKSGHRLIHLHQRLSSYCHIRKMHSDYMDYNAAFMLIDDTAVVFRSQASRFEASIYYQAPTRAQELGKFFSEVWECSEADPQVRRLFI